MITESGQGIIGSPSKNNPGELYTFEVQYNLLQKIYLRQKRIFDLFFSLSVFIFSWLIILIQHNKLKFLSNLYEVIVGKKTWVGYSKEIAEKYQLPIIKTGIIIPNIGMMEHHFEVLSEPIIRNYAWNYSVWMDLDICLKAINQLDQ
jgi:lipopolysaccharide/colanic/teichoic acid biosynthesis glycosyltransferase